VLLSAELGFPVEVAFGSARREVLVARPWGPGLRVRMHSGFAAAPREVRRAVAVWLGGGPRAPQAARVLDEWIEGVLVPSFASEGPSLPSPRRPFRAHHDLERLAEELRRGGLLGDLLPSERWPRITWGTRRRTGARHSLHLGTYDAAQRLVRLHPVLDQPAVPAFFVRYILFHELLHAALPGRREGGRTIHHGPEFRRRERAYPDYERARRWEAENIAELLRSTRTGRDLGRPRGPATGRAVQGLLFE
jgi:hypothetical protein